MKFFKFIAPAITICLVLIYTLTSLPVVQQSQAAVFNNNTTDDGIIAIHPQETVNNGSAYAVAFNLETTNKTTLQVGYTYYQYFCPKTNVDNNDPESLHTVNGSTGCYGNAKITHGTILVGPSTWAQIPAITSTPAMANPQYKSCGGYQTDISLDSYTKRNSSHTYQSAGWNYTNITCVVAPTATPTTKPTPTTVPTATPTTVPTATPTTAPTCTPTPTVTEAPSITPTGTLTPTAVPTVTNTPTPTDFITSTPTPTGVNTNNCDGTTQDGNGNNNNCNQNTNNNNSDNSSNNDNSSDNSSNQNQNQTQDNNQSVTINLAAGTTTTTTQPVEEVLGTSTVTQLPSTGTPIEVWELFGGITPLGFFLRKLARK